MSMQLFHGHPLHVVTPDQMHLIRRNIRLAYFAHQISGFTMKGQLTFGLYGGFPGDKEKLAAATALAAQLCGPQASAVTVASLLQVLESLPFGGRVEFMLRAVCESPARDVILRRLFDACFDAAPEKTSSRLGAEGRTLKDFATLRLLTMVLPSAGPLAVELFQSYQETSSTVLFQPFLQAMVASADFTDAQLEAVFLGTVDVSKRAILDLSKFQSHRRHFLGRMVEQKLAPLALLPYADAEAVESLLSSGTAAEVEAFEALGFPCWQRLSSVYLAHFRRRLTAKANDPIGNGKIYRQLENRAQAMLQPQHIADFFALCAESSLLQVDVAAPQGVRAYLEELSSQGKLAKRPYEFLSLCLPSDSLITRLRPEDKVAMLRTHTKTDNPRGWEFSKSFFPLCSSLLNASTSRRTPKRLMVDFAMEAMDALSEEVLWDEITGAAKRSEPDLVRKTFQEIKRFLNFGQWSETRLTGIAIGRWLALHQRALPTAERSLSTKFTESKLWTLWHTHATSRIMEHLGLIAGGRALASLNRCSIDAQRSTITSYVGATFCILEKLEKVLSTPGQDTEIRHQLATVASVTDIVMPIFNRALEFRFPESSVAGIKVDALRNVIQRMIQAALQRCVENLGFDPAKGYEPVAVRHAELSPLILKLTSSAHLLHFPGIQSLALTMCTTIYEQSELPPEAARLGFMEVAAPDAISFVHFKLNLHKSWQQTAMQLVTALHNASKTLDAKLAAQVWELYKSKRYPGGQIPSSRQEFLSYLGECQVLPASIVTQEKPALISLAVEQLLVNDQSAVSLLTCLEWLKEALDGCGDQFPLRQQLLLKSGSLVGQAEVRELLQAATSGADPAARIQGHVELMRRSLADLSELAMTLTYVAQRTRNEAGLHRPLLYQWLEQQTATSIVPLALASAAKAPAAGVTKVLQDISAICDAMERMLREDVAKRDSVAKNSFRKISSLLFSATLTWDPSHPILDARKRLISCATQLECIVLKVLHGEDGAAGFLWPRNMTLSRLHTFPEAWLEDVRSFFTQTFRAGSNRFDEFRISVYMQGLQRESSKGPRFDVADAIETLIDVGTQVGCIPREEWDMSTLRREFPDQNQSVPMFSRASLLFRLADMRWPEVPRLVKFLESIVNALDDRATVRHAQQVHNLFTEIVVNYRDGSLWYEIPLLARTIERLLAIAVRLKLGTVARDIHTRWRELKMSRGLTPIASVLTKDLQLERLVAEVPALGSFVLLENLEFSSPSAVERAARSVYELTHLTPSAAYVCVDDFVGIRDDLLLKYVHRTRGQLCGVFDPNMAPLKENQKQELAPITVSATHWVKLNEPTMRTYTNDALDKALNPSVSPYARSAAIQRFVQSPASTHLELIKVLSKLNSPPAKDQGGEADAGASLLLETITLRVFETDAAWFVLEYLLSPEVISTSSGRTTASILTNMHSWVPMDKVIDVLRVLLEPGRRQSLSVFLHKSILRMLFESTLATAQNLFLSEWTKRKENRTHSDVVFDMIKQAVVSLGANLPDECPKMQTAWLIMNEVAESQSGSFPVLTVMLLLLPTFRPALPGGGGALQSLDDLIRRPIAPSMNPEAADSFGSLHQTWMGQTLVAFSSLVTRERMIAICSAIAKSSGSENPYLRTMATLKEFTFSRFAMGLEDDEALGKLQKLLLSATIQWPPKAWPFPVAGQDVEDFTVFSLAPEDDFFLQVASKMFASFGAQVLSMEMAKFTAHERQTQPNLLKDICKRLNVALRLRGVMELLLEAMARVAPIDVEKCVRLTCVAQGMLTVARERGYAEVLFLKHFDGAIAFLRRNQALLKL